MKAAHDAPQALDATQVPAASQSQNVSGNADGATRRQRFRQRHARIDFVTTPRIHATVQGLAQHLGCSRNDVMNSLVRFALTNRNWRQVGLYGSSTEAA